MQIPMKGADVEGMIKVSYTVMCENDVQLEVRLDELLANEKVAKAIKSEFAKGLRNLTLTSTDESTLHIKTEKQVYEFTVSKDDFADILELAEEDARKHKRIKKECEGIELVDIVTLD
jgi:RNase P/RNase MRP subunit p30